MNDKWDRSKQTYWISKHGGKWSVISQSTGKRVSEYPSFNYDLGLMRQVCFAESDENVIRILNKETRDNT